MVLINLPNQIIVLELMIKFNLARVTNEQTESMSNFKQIQESLQTFPIKGGGWFRPITLEKRF